MHIRQTKIRSTVGRPIYLFISPSDAINIKCRTYILRPRSTQCSILNFFNDLLVILWGKVAIFNYFYCGDERTEQLDLLWNNSNLISLIKIIIISVYL